MKLYSLFEKQDGKWVRLSKYSLKKADAIRHWQPMMLDYVLGDARNERRIKSVKPEDSEFWTK